MNVAGDFLKIFFSTSSLGITLVLICTHCHFFSRSLTNDQNEEHLKGYTLVTVLFPKIYVK